MSDVEEKRKYKRANMQLPIRYKKLDQYGIPATTDNIGGGGLMFFSTQDIPISTYLVLELPLPIYPEPIKIQGRVVWTRKNIAQNNYSIGVEFSNIVELDKEKLIKYIEERL